LAGLVVLSFSLGCVRPPARRPDTPPAPVIVTKAAIKTVPLQIRSIGTVKPVSTYLVKPRVSGELLQVHFNEGDDVKRGQKLFTIDPRQYENAVDRATATLDKHKALLAGALRDLDRVDRAVRAGVASREDLDDAQTKVAIAKASQAEDEAALHAAKLQLSFTTITSPIGGRSGEVHVTTGNLVNPMDSTPLAEVVQIAPIDVVFSLPEHLLPQVDEARRHGPLTVMVTPRNGDSSVVGLLAFTDNTVDTTTGTVQLKAFMKNEDRKLWPGQFVDIVLTIGERPRSVVVPTAAVQSGQAGPYVYVIGKDQKAEIRQVTVAFQEGSDAIIASGLKGGETVVVEGQIRLAPGVKVDVRNGERGLRNDQPETRKEPSVPTPTSVTPPAPTSAIPTPASVTPPAPTSAIPTSSSAIPVPSSEFPAPAPRSIEGASR